MKLERSHGIVQTGDGNSVDGGDGQTGIGTQTHQSIEVTNHGHEGVLSKKFSFPVLASLHDLVVAESCKSIVRTGAACFAGHEPRGFATCQQASAVEQAVLVGR